MVKVNNRVVRFNQLGHREIHVFGQPLVVHAGVCWQIARSESKDRPPVTVGAFFLRVFVAARGMERGISQRGALFRTYLPSITEQKKKSSPPTGE